MTSAAPDAQQGARAPARVVLWFRNDLRLHDNALLERAAALGDAAVVLPVFVADPSQQACRLLADTPRCGPHRARALAAAVADLRARLRRAGSGLAVLEGAPAEALARLRPDVVLTHAEFAHEERAAEAAVAAALRAQGGALQLLPADTLWAADALPFAPDLHDLPTSGVTFLKRVRAAAAPAPPLGDGLAQAAQLRLGAVWAAHPALDAPLPGPTPSTDALGGESAGLALLQTYLWGTDAVRSYAATRNELRGGSGLSPFLALGCLSARHVAAKLARYDERHPGATDAIGFEPGGLLFELGVRDFFRFAALRWGAALFAAQGAVPRQPPQVWSDDAAALHAWRVGATGVPLIDAIMRQLLRDGHISNRARQITASWAVLARGLDWRCCAEHFESLLADYDPSANAGNWQAVCGLSGGRENWFSVAKQSSQFDADGSFVREFVPELARLPTEQLHAPWTLTADALAACGVVLGVTYPAADLAALRAPPARPAAKR